MRSTRQQRWSVLAMAAGLLVGCGDGSVEVGSSESDIRARKLQLEGSAELALVEVSGLALRGHDESPELVAIGDAARQLLTAPWHDVSDQRIAAPGGEVDDDGSQWEAVAADASGRVFVLNEQTLEIEVFDAQIEELVHRVTLDIEAESWAEDKWGDDPNSGAEGMVLLNNGHVIVAKEKDDALLFELGPAGAEPQGYAPELALDLQGVFPLPEGEVSTLVPLKSWRLRNKHRDDVEDISDLAVGPDGYLYLLSDESRAIVQTDRELLPEEKKIDIERLYQLPGELEKPEGLAFVGRHPLVVFDLEQQGDNLLLMSKVKAP